MLYKILLTILILFFSCNFSIAKNAKKNSPKLDKTIITSNLIDIKQKTRIIDFLGNVNVKKGSDMMNSQKMRLYYNDNTKKPKSQAKNEKTVPSKQNQGLSDENSIEKIEAQGDVKVFTKDFVATADLGFYNPKEELFILEKNVIVNNGDSIGNGNKFIYNLKTKKGNFVGKSKDLNPNADNRVVVIIGDKKNKKENKK